MSYNLPLSPSSWEPERELRKRMPRLQTQTSDLMKPPAIDTPSTGGFAVKSPTSASHQRFVLTDHVAFRYLEEDASTTVLSRREKLVGYEIYLVEQWACSRIHPTFIITTYTGDPKDTVLAAVLSVPKDESQWSPQMRTYFKALDEYHARRKETSLGTLMITNLSGFPSSLTIIPIPEGNLKKHRELFFVNENLKRLGCSGRLGIKLAPPSSATQAKFHQLYRTSDKIPLNSSVIELVKLCQVALVIFGKLQPEYADGLLCDITEKAVNDWWAEFGAEYYTVEPHDGILGPTTVAGLLGMLIGARNRLSAYNAPVAKDVFDVESTKRGIAYFQKTQRIQRTHRLDRQTLERLRKATAKAASKESWAVPRAFKTTVAELGGKGGEMVMGMVGAGEKAGIAEIETVDIERFVELVSGERAKWLWYGKPRKSNTDMFSRLPREDRSTSPDDHQPTHIVGLLKRESTLEGHGIAKHDTLDLGKHADPFGAIDGLEKERDPNSKRAAIKRATEKIESGTGFHRIKDVVGRRNHQPKPSKEETLLSPVPNAKTDVWSPNDLNSNSSLTSKLHSSPRESQDLRSETLSPQTTATDKERMLPRVTTEESRDWAGMPVTDQSTQPSLEGNSELTMPSKPQLPEDEDSSKPPTVDNSVAGSIYCGIDLNSKLPHEDTDKIPPLLRRTGSVDQLDTYHRRSRNDNWWPRHLSFGIAEESVLRWPSIVTSTTLSNGAPQSLSDALVTQRLLSEETLRLRHNLALLSTLDRPWVDHAIDTITDLDAAAEADTLQLEALYYPALESYHALREDAHEIVSSSRAHLNDAVRDLANLSDKLEYEIGALRSKVEDVDDGVAELEQQVLTVEGKVAELDAVLRGAGREGWVHWAVRMFTGIGRRPG